MFTVRLVDGSSYNEGRVEVYYSGRWGTVCNDGWTDRYASLVCAQLGFTSSKLADFGAGVGSIFLEKVMCSVNDAILASCGHYGVGITAECDHSDDVGVKCYGWYLQNYDYLITNYNYMKNSLSYTCIYSIQFFLNQARAGLEIAFVRKVGMFVCVCVCVCPPPRLLITFT